MGKTPVLEKDKILLPEYSYPVCLPQMTETWQKWLEKNRSFRFEDEYLGVNFTACKDTRGYWTAQKRIQGKLYQKRLGTSEMLAQLSPGKLTEVAQELGTDSPPSPQELQQEISRLRRKLEQQSHSNHTLDAIRGIVGRYRDEASKTSPRWSKALQLIAELEELL